jgi:HK97 family phage portal protein
MSRLELYRPARLTWRQRFNDAVRSYWRGPWNSGDPALSKYYGEGRSVSSGVTVTEDSALTFSAFRSGVARIANDISSLPLMFYRRLEDGGKQRWDTHYLYGLLHDQPNPEQTSMVFRRTLQGHVVVWGNAFAEIERDGGDRPRGLWPIHPCRVYVEREGGRLRYRVRNQSRADVYIAPENMLHLRAFGTDDGTVGDSLVSDARESIGLAIAAERYGAGFFGTGSTMAGLISWPQGAVMSDASRKDYLKVIQDRHQGVDNAHKILALFDGADFKPFGIPPNAAQFLETRTFQVRDVARWLHIPPHLLADLADATFSNVEQMRTEYYQSCLRPWQELWEQELTAKLISPLERRQQMIEHVTQGFLAGDSTARAAYYREMDVVGAIQINEIRGRENLNPVVGGNETFVPLQKIPIDLARPYWEASIAKMEADAEAAKRPPVVTPPANDTEEEIKALKVQLEVARIDLQRAEDLQEKAEQERDEARRCQAEAESVNAALATERDEQIALAKALDGQLILESRRHEETRAVLLTAHADAEAALAELLTTRARLTEVTDERRLALQERDQARTELAEWQELYATVQTQRNEAQARAEAAESQLAVEQAANARHALTITERDETIEALHTALTERTLVIQHLKEDCDGLERERNDARSERAALSERLAAAHAETAAAAQTILSVRDELAQATEREQALLLEKQLFSEDIDTLQQQLRGAELCIDTERAIEAQRRAGVLAAHRALFVDAMGRMVRRETEKARRQQGTPQKLRAWAQTFYPSFEDICVEALLPAVRVHLAWMQAPEDPHAVTLTLVRQHIADSTRQLSAVCDVGAEELPQALERTLTRWEQKRPDALADALLQEGIDHVRS